MEPIHIFYKERSTNKKKIFTANLAEKNEFEEVKLKNLENMQL